MSDRKSQLLGEYAEGWATGDTGKILAAAAPDFVFTDPDGPVRRERFEEYHGGFKAENGPTMDLSGVVTYEVGEKLVACCLWQAGGVRGTGLITVGESGVEREDVSIL
jgi:hypothetical protein